VIELRFEAGVDALHPRRPTPRLLLAAAVAALLLGGGCEQRSQTTLTGHPVRARDVAKLTIGGSTAADVERVFGPPDERAEDGALVYRASAVRRSGRSFAGFLVGGTEEVLSQRTAKFRFADGVLTQVCRERS